MAVHISVYSPGENRLKGRSRPSLEAARAKSGESRARRRDAEGGMLQKTSLRRGVYTRPCGATWVRGGAREWARRLPVPASVPQSGAHSGSPQPGCQSRSLAKHTSSKFSKVLLAPCNEKEPLPRPSTNLRVTDRPMVIRIWGTEWGTENFLKKGLTPWLGQWPHGVSICPCSQKGTSI